MVIRTFKDIRDEVLVKLAEAGQTGNLKTEINNVINEAHRWRVGGRKWPFMRWSTPQTFTLVSGQRFYALHPETGILDYVYNKPRMIYMVELPERNIEGMQVFNTQNDLKYFRLGEVWPTQYQPSASSTISAVSSSASDTTQTVTIRGESGGVVGTETKTLTGTSPVTTTKSFTKILGVTLSAVGVGNITISAGATTLVVIPIGSFGLQYRTLELLASPTSLDEIEYVFYRQPSPLVNDNDIPDLPSPHGGTLVWDTLIQLTGYITDINPNAISVWKEAQSRCETALEQEWLQPQTRGAQPKFIRYFKDNFNG